MSPHDFRRIVLAHELVAQQLAAERKQEPEPDRSEQASSDTPAIVTEQEPTA